MQEYNGDRFYVGKLSFQLEKNLDSRLNHLIIGDYDEYRRAITNGAIDLDNLYQDNMNLVNNQNYKEIYALFYRLDSGKYLCLQNNKIYGTLSRNFVSYLEPLYDLLPKMNFSSYNSLSFNKARKLFNKALDGNSLYSRYLIYPIHKFYTGNIQLCTEKIIVDEKYPYHKRMERQKLTESILLKDFWKMEYEKIARDGKGKYHFRIFQSLFYLFENGTLYSLNSNRLYAPNEMNTEERKITITNNLMNELEKRKIHYNNNNITIPKVLKLEKKIF